MQAQIISRNVRLDLEASVLATIKTSDRPFTIEEVQECLLATNPEDSDMQYAVSNVKRWLSTFSNALCQFKSKFVCDELADGRYLLHGVQMPTEPEAGEEKEEDSEPEVFCLADVLPEMYSDEEREEAQAWVDGFEKAPVDSRQQVTAIITMNSHISSRDLLRAQVIPNSQHLADNRYRVSFGDANRDEVEQYLTSQVEKGYFISFELAGDDETNGAELCVEEEDDSWLYDTSGLYYAGMSEEQKQAAVASLKGSQEQERDLHPIETMSDADLAELGVTRTQITSWGKRMQEEERTTRETVSFLDSMRDTE